MKSEHLIAVLDQYGALGFFAVEMNVNRWWCDPFGQIGLNLGLKIIPFRLIIFINEAKNDSHNNISLRSGNLLSLSNSLYVRVARELAFLICF